jgi:hypothetical protein
MARGYCMVLMLLAIQYYCMRCVQSYVIYCLYGVLLLSMLHRMDHTWKYATADQICFFIYRNYHYKPLHCEV